MKRLITNADDLGLSPEVNAGVLRAHRDGVLTSASLMVASPARDEAVAIAKNNPALDVGLHLVVCRGWSVLGPDELAGVVGRDRSFSARPVRAGFSYFFNRTMREKLRAECRAQVESHLRLLGYLNHIDGHLNFHVHPVLSEMLLELAVEYRVPCLRIPREPVFATLGLARDHLIRKLVEAAIFRTLSVRARRKMAARGLKSSDWLFGLHQSGHLTERYLLGVVGRLREGTTELYFHPAADVGAMPPAPGAQLEVELLSSPRLRAALDANGVRLTTFAELARG